MPVKVNPGEPALQSPASDGPRRTPRGHNLNYTIWTLDAESVSFPMTCHFPLGRARWNLSSNLGHARWNLSSNLGRTQWNQSRRLGRAHIPVKEQCAQNLEWIEKSSFPCPSPWLCLGTVIVLAPSWTFSEDHFQNCLNYFSYTVFAPPPLPVQPLPFARSNYLNSKSDMPFSTKQIWGAPSEIKKATWGTPHLIKKATLGRALFNQEGNFGARAPFNQEGKFEQIIVTNPPFSHPTLCETTRPFLIQPFVKQPALSSSSPCETIIF